MSSTTANNAEFQTVGKPVAQPVYMVDNGGNASYGSVANPLATNQLVGTPVYGTTTMSSGGSGNASLAAASGKKTYINGFYVSVAHTASSTVSGQVTLSLDGGVTTHMNFTIAVSSAYPGLVNMDFPDPIPALSVNTSIVVTCPALSGAGNGSIAVFGYQL